MKAILKPGYVGRKLKDVTRELYDLFDSLLDRIRREYDPRDR